MGLALEVGMLADLLIHDLEGAEHYKGHFASLNRYLPSVGMKLHNEPENCEVFSCQMLGYSGLHYLRRLAAHVQLRPALPPPGEEHIDIDPVLQEYFRLANAVPQNFLTKLLQGPPKTLGFDHLINHSDAEGFYIPQDFQKVLVTPAEFKIPGQYVGSSIRLLDECKRLAEILELPLDMDIESEEAWQLPDGQGEGGPKYKNYGKESFHCLRLYKAAEHSIKTGAAIVFC